jgi:prepilin-type N-terminal cleavage/methylation domain-containing protein
MSAVANRRGVTLVEVMTVVAILGLMAIILGFSFQGWFAKYKVEDQTKRFYADVMDARARAMLKKRVAFVHLEAGRYRTFEDTNSPPDGNGALEVGLDTLVADSERTWAGGLAYPIDFSGLDGAPPIRFDREGLASPTGTIRLVSTLSPDYDCITVATTRIRMGRWNGASCEEK